MGPVPKSDRVVTFDEEGAKMDSFSPGTESDSVSDDSSAIESERSEISYLGQWTPETTWSSIECQPPVLSSTPMGSNEELSRQLDMLPSTIV